MKRIAIIGGGPAGILAAYASNQEVDLYEKNEKLGKKLYITGKGRCNITNNNDISEFFDQILRNPYFCYSSLYTFTNIDIVRLLENNGLHCKVERGDRVFPVSDKSSDVLKTFRCILSKKENLKIRLNCEVTDILKKGEKFLVKTRATQEEYDSVIIATGGLSYPSTGSTGFGYEIAKKYNHPIKAMIPSLVPLILKEDWISDLEGLTLKNVNISLRRNKKVSYFGDLLFNKDGITGPIGLKLSTHGKTLKSDDQFLLDLKPALTVEQLDKRILRDFQRYQNKDIQNALFDLLPRRLIPVIIAMSNIDERKKVHQVSKEERKNLVRTIKSLALTFKKLRSFKEAIITNGGIDVGEINSSTMESKIIKNLYFAGEVIDIDAMTGGYNLQLAYSTGYLAGLSSGEG